MKTESDSRPGTELTPRMEPGALERRERERGADPVEYEPPSSGRLVAVFGKSTRSGEWEPPERLDAVAVFGSVSLDFRHALLPPGVTEVEALAVFGGVDIVVPPELEVEVETGLSLFGSVEERHARSSRVRDTLRRFLFGEPGPRHAADLPDDDPPILYVRARVLFGGVKVVVKP